jgi:hypothetical protein
VRNQDHPGVSVVPGDKPSYPFHMSFKHPLLKGKQVKRSTKTTDGAQAAKLAIELSTILRNPNVWRKLPAETSEVVRAVWNGEVIDQTLVSAANEARPRGWYGEFYRPDWIRAASHAALVKAANEMAEENTRLHEENAILSAKVNNLTALLRKMGFEAAREYTPKLLTQACKDFLSDDKSRCGTNAGERKKRTLQSWLDRFTEAQPAGALVHEITAQHVIEHLAKLHAGKLDGQTHKPTDETVREVAKWLNAMLEHQTGGSFRKLAVREWVRKHLYDDTGDAREAPYWLDENDVQVLMVNLPQYWRDVACVQWNGGFRPEELAYIRRENVALLKDEIRVEITALKIDGVLFWKPKTRQSCGRVHVREEARRTLTRLCAHNSFLLFPDDHAVHGGITTRWKEVEKTQERLKLWRVANWTSQYRAALRVAARKAGLDDTRVDSRTLRRSCGKRVLVEGGYNLELTAAVLRDKPETVRQHYARLLPEDVRQPQAAK